MITINTIKNFINGLDRKEFIFYSSIYLGFCLFLVFGIMIRHIYVMQEAKNKIISLNQARKKVQEVLTQFSQVIHQRNNVDALLQKDKSFYLQKFFKDLIQQPSLMIKNVNDKPSTQKLENGYTEESLNVTLTAITTQQLCMLLKEIENEERIYIKSLDITKPIAKKINVSMVIATLIPK
ncbi:hypothetical protein HYV11_03360 [Candidatus Dependentiae bacterium]|nr:hypothetical protein [Candidatus Dependentiae bacterium]